MPKETDGWLHANPDSVIDSRQWLPVVYHELKHLATQKLARESPHHTLQPTALVHEAFLRLIGEAESDWESRAHFFGAAAEAMRRILVDHARAKQRLKRRSSVDRQIDPDSVPECDALQNEELIALDEALGRLAEIDELKASIVNLKFFAGLSIDEASRILRISPRTGERYWAFARAWLYQEMQRER